MNLKAILKFASRLGFKGAYSDSFERGEEPRSGAVVVTRPMAQSVWAYRCIRDISDTLSGVPIRISREGTSTSRELGFKYPSKRRFGCKAAADNLVENGPAYELLLRPNSNQSWTQFLQELIMHLEHDGNVFILFEEMTGLKPRSLRVASKPYMRPAIGRDGTAIGWVHTQGGIQRPYDLTELVHIKFPNPYDLIWGLSPGECYTLSQNADVSAATFNKTAFDNNAEPGATLTFPNGLSDDQFDRIKAQWNSRHRGPGNAKRTAVIDNGGKVEAFASTHVEMQYLEGRKFSREEAAAAYGVPLERLSGLQNSNRSTGQVGERAYWNQTLIPLATLIADALTTKIIWRYDAGLAAWFDFSLVPAMQEQYRENISAAKDVVLMGASFAQVNEMFDLGYECKPEQEEIWIGAGLAPARLLLNDLNLGPSLPEGDLGQEPGTSNQNPEKKSACRCKHNSEEDGDVFKDAGDRIWLKWANSWKPIEKQYAARVKAHFAKQCSEMLRRLAKQNPATKREGVKSIDIGTIVLDWREESKKLRLISETYIKDAMEVGAGQGLEETEQENTADNRMRMIDSPVSRKIRKRIAAKLVNVDQVTTERVREELFEGINKGETLTELAGRIRGVFSGSTMRAMRIARTETSMAASSGRQRAFVESGVTGKVWLCARDKNVRDAHRKAGEDYASPISIDQPFIVGGEKLMHPGDPSGSPGNVINCRCVHLAKRIQETKAESIKRYSSVIFFGYAELVADREKRLAS